jgi:hypothetical protein
MCRTTQFAAWSARRISSAYARQNPFSALFLGRPLELWFRRWIICARGHNTRNEEPERINYRPWVHSLSSSTPPTTKPPTTSGTCNFCPMDISRYAVNAESIDALSTHQIDSFFCRHKSITKDDLNRTAARISHAGHGSKRCPEVLWHDSCRNSYQTRSAASLLDCRSG